VHLIAHLKLLENIETKILGQAIMKIAIFCRIIVVIVIIVAGEGL
jgi:hypothetical protein